MIAWLWDAPGPGVSACGISGSLEAARREAALSLRSGQAESARVEAAAGDLGGRMLTDGYRRTGHGWTARSRPGGRVDWTPLRAGVTAPGHELAADAVRAMIDGGTLKPGWPVPRKAELAGGRGRKAEAFTGAFRLLIGAGVLRPGLDHRDLPFVVSRRGGG